MPHFFTIEILTELKYRAIGRHIAIQALIALSDDELAKLYDSDANERKNYTQIVDLFEELSVKHQGILNIEGAVDDIKAIFLDCE
jgi:hypothetical protein